jgi:hypothetical protein
LRTTDKLLLIQGRFTVIIATIVGVTTFTQYMYSGGCKLVLSGKIFYMSISMLLNTKIYFTLRIQFAKL